jgi:transposase
VGDSKGMKRARYPSDLSDAQWKRIERLVPAPKFGGRPAKHDRLAILNAILYLVRTGCAWRLLPHDMPSWKTVYHYYFRATSETIIYIAMIGLMIPRLARE